MPSGPDEGLPICISSTSVPAKCSWRIKNAPSMSFTGNPFRLVFRRGCLDSRDVSVVPVVFLATYCAGAGGAWPDELSLVLVAAQYRHLLRNRSPGGGHSGSG